VVATYRNAVSIMQGKPANDPFNWTNYAKIHGLDPNRYHFCPHGNWYFLPWHRAYVVGLERIVRMLTNNHAFAMPYWDWTANPTMPDVFLSPKLPDGKPNALYVSDPNWRRTWPPKEPMPDDQVGPKVLDEILHTTPFEAFGTSRPRGQNSLAQSWITTGTGFQGPLERTPHNNVHNNIGGWMPSALSPMDPIFFMHHSNIDRIWAVWNFGGNTNSSDPLWADMTFQNNFVNTNGTPWSPKVSDLYDPETLGYTYGLGAPLAFTTAVRTVALDDKFTMLIKNPVNAEGIEIVHAAPPVAAASARLETTAQVAPAILSKLRLNIGTVHTEVNTTNLLAGEESTAGGTHVFALIRDVVASAPTQAEYRVFLNATNPTAATPASDPHYVGNFAIFHHGMKMGHPGMTPSFVFDLTETIRSIGNSDSLKVQIVAVPNRPGVDPGTVTAGSIEIAFVTP
jgi:tyrosinase